ncbi:hypothetical protein J0B02_07450 [Enterobacteriaceae bacterium YMB-R22]|uniref:hypothetical protein n=1 Tax=Tenebrionicola larvae TaxID=2815733 RepID=UPI00201333AD|nr:hypothetical protein [Tenebrionicola larvae]MBV4412660.1 hypothetical protein [Tenebrionicola larvae]
MFELDSIYEYLLRIKNKKNITWEEIAVFLGVEELVTIGMMMGRIPMTEVQYQLLDTLLEIDNSEVKYVFMKREKRFDLERLKNRSQITLKLLQQIMIYDVPIQMISKENFGTINLSFNLLKAVVKISDGENLFSVTLTATLSDPIHKMKNILDLSHQSELSKLLIKKIEEKGITYEELAKEISLSTEEACLCILDRQALSEEAKKNIKWLLDIRDEEWVETNFIPPYSDIRSMSLIYSSSILFSLYKTICLLGEPLAALLYENGINEDFYLKELNIEKEPAPAGDLFILKITFYN